MLTALLAGLCCQSTAVPLHSQSVSRYAQFGASVAIDDGTIIVGARWDMVASQRTGSLHIYRQDPVAGTWSAEARLEGVGNEGLGRTVDIDGDIALAVAGFPDPERVEIFERSAGSWTNTATLTYPGSGTAVDAAFGRSSALQGDRVVVGAPFARDGAGGVSGAVYVFERGPNGWALDQRILPSPDPTTGQIPLTTRFGRQVRLDGNLLAIGAPRAFTTGGQAGGVHIYERSAAVYSEIATIESPNLQGNFEFGGRGLGLAQRRLTVGSIGTFVGGFDTAGMVHTYVEGGTGWHEAERLPDPLPSRSAAFGYRVAVDDERLLVGRSAYHRQHSSSEELTVESFVWSGTGWAREPAIPDPHDAGDTYFGTALSLDGEMLVVGSPLHFTGGENGGGAYVSPVPNSWEPIADIVCSNESCACSPYLPWKGCGNGAGEFSQLASYGSPSISADDLEFHASGLTPGVLAHLIMGPVQWSPRPFGDGTLCVGAARSLLPRQVAPDGTLYLPPGILSRAAAQLGMAGVVVAGESWVFQVMYDEPRTLFGCASYPGTGFILRNGRPYSTLRGFNLTPGLRVTFRP